jgi:hypothetical protein
MPARIDSRPRSPVVCSTELIDLVILRGSASGHPYPERNIQFRVNTRWLTAYQPRDRQ